MATVYFPKDSYHTDPDKPRDFLDKLALNTRIYYIPKYAAIILKARRTVLEGRYDDKEWAISSIDIFRLIEACGGKFHLTGLDNIRRCKPPVVFISNHMSILETMIFPCIIAPEMEVTFVVKDSLITHPIFGPVMRSRNPIVVGRSNSRDDLHTVLTKGQELLAKGVSVIVFPQSTRRVDFVPEEFNSLGVKLASKAGVQVLPIAIKTDFWENGRFIKDLGPIKRHRPIYMDFGAPLSLTGTGKEEQKKVVEFISQRLNAWKTE